MANTAPVIFVDVDDTLIRTFDGKRTPISHMVSLVRDLRKQGAELYCWSRGGAAYAHNVALEFGLVDCFSAFLPKPALLLDDADMTEWNMTRLHPAECSSLTAAEVLSKLTQ
jgi:predicted HAD superfamily phosphohydrolase YqeG